MNISAYIKSGIQNKEFDKEIIIEAIDTIKNASSHHQENYKSHHKDIKNSKGDKN